jgi:hypothetical protein
MSVDEYIPADVQDEEEVVAMESDLFIQGIDPQQPMIIAECGIGYYEASCLSNLVEPICKMQVIEGKCLLCVTDTAEHLSPVSRGLETFLQHCRDTGRFDLCEYVIARPNTQHVLHASCRRALAYESRKTANAKANDDQKIKRATRQSTTIFNF